MPACGEISTQSPVAFFKFSGAILKRNTSVSKQVFVSQLKMSHGSVCNSGLKLLQMFPNDRLQCQHKPTSTFAHYIFVFDVVHMNFTVRRTHSGLPRNPQVDFVDQEKLSECGFVCQHKTISASYMQC